MAELLTTSQVAEILGVTPRTIRYWESSGKFKAATRTKGGHRRFALEDVRKKLDQRFTPHDGINY